MKTISFITPTRQLPQSLCKHGYETGISDALLHYWLASPPHTHLALKAIHSIPSKARVTHTKKTLYLLKIKLFLLSFIESFQQVKHYYRDNILFIISRFHDTSYILVAVMQKLLSPSLLLNRQLQVH